MIRTQISWRDADILDRGRGCCVMLIGLFVALTAQAANPPSSPPAAADIAEAIRRGRERLLEIPGTPGDSESALAAYAAIKAGIPASHPKILEIVDAVVRKIDNGAYGSGRDPPHHVYEAACEAMLLGDVDAEAHRPRLEVLRDYILRRQKASGAWHYPATPRELEAGDSSITQFAVLGLWAVSRAKVPVPPTAWESCAKWWQTTQRPDGSFCYHPQESDPLGHKATIAMTSAGCSCLLICQLMLFNDETSKLDAPPTSRKRFGVLESIPFDRVREKPDPVAPPKIKLSSESIDRSLKRGIEWLAGHFEFQRDAIYAAYEQYACERTGTLMDTEHFGSHRWYDEGARGLLDTQTKNGEWTQAGTSAGSLRPNTAFALLFLSRATKTIVAPRVKVKMTGGGLLAGGKGLPDDLSKVALQDGGVKTRKPLGPVDELLKDLEQINVDEPKPAAEEVVAALQFDRPDELLSKLNEMPRYLKHSDPVMRQVAAWVLGRSNDLRKAPLLIAALADPDLDVVADVSLALCVLSRQPQGVLKSSLSNERVAPEPPDPTQPDAKTGAAAVAEWRRDSQRGWTQWYLQVRPYDERDDRQQLRTK